MITINSSVVLIHLHGNLQQCIRTAELLVVTIRLCGIHWIVLVETWHGHCPSYISPDSEPFPHETFFSLKGEIPSHFQIAGYSLNLTATALGSGSSEVQKVGEKSEKHIRDVCQR